jgi:hypothetical protein
MSNKHNWKPMLVVGSAVAGAGVAVAVGSTDGSSWIAACALGAVISIGLMALGLLTVASRRLTALSRQVTDVSRQVAEVHSLSNLRPMVGELPLPPLGGWAIDPALAEKLTELVIFRKPQLVVECGSGASTVLIASCLRSLGTGRLVALEHQAEFHARTVTFLERHSLTEWADVRHAPLVTSAAVHEMPWYDIRQIGHLDRPIDILLVDGPPATLGPLARYPAVPLLIHDLSATAIVLLDDGRRPDETAIARRWQEELGGSLEFVECTHGAWLIQRNADP